MSLSNELKELESLLGNGTLTQEEFQIAKRRVLEGSPIAGQSSQLEELKAQNELTQLDREWEMERETYMVTGKYGTRYLPGRISSVVSGIVIGCFGTFWTIMALSITAHANAGLIGIAFPLFGIAFVIFGIAISVISFIKAGQYQEALERYQLRRRELLERSNDS